MNGKSKGLIPKLRFPEFKGGLAWDEKALKDVCEVNPQGNGLPESFVYIDLESVEGGVLLSRKRIDRQDAPSRAQRLLNNGDVVFQIVRPYQRNNLFIQFNDGQEYVASTGYAQLRAYESGSFLYQLVHTDLFVEKVIAKCTGSSYPAINSNDLAEVPVFVPKLAEQRKIAACLTSLDEWIEAEGRKLEALWVHKKGLMRQLFPREGETRPRLRFPEFNDTWAECTLGALSTSISSGRDINSRGGRYDLYGSTGVIGKASNGTFVGTFLLVARVGANAGLLTKVDGAFGVTDNTLVIDLVEKRNNDFLFYYLVNFGLSRMIFGSGQPLITGGQLKALPILLPGEPERERIAASLSSLDALITAQSRKLDGLRAHKKGLMQRLFPSPEGV